jgi:uncharacterized BrkB/YihY/UPF0761 family membrane protein
VPSLLRVLLALTILIVWAATLFHVGPHHRTPWRFDLPGAIFTAAGWLAVSVGFGFYVRIAVSGIEIVGADQQDEAHQPKPGEGEQRGAGGADDLIA